MHLIHTMAYGGIETAVINWIHKIDRTQFDVHLVCFANPGNTEDPFVKSAEKLEIPVEKILWGKGKPIFFAAIELKQLIRKHHIDILHTHNCYADLVGAIVSLLTPVKTITTVYVWSKFDWKRNILQIINRFAIRFFDRVSAHCENTYEKTASFIPENKLKLLICGFEFNMVEILAEERQRRRQEYGIEGDQILLANIARFYPEKAQDSLLRCFREIVQQCPKARLWILGVGPLEDQVKALCAKLGLDSTVKFMGFVDNLFEILPLIDIQVHPSHMEGVPLSICSGMAAGLPIVASDVGGIKEVLKNEKNGILIPRGDHEAFNKQVIRLIRSPQERNRLGSAASHFIKNDYSLKRAVGEVEKTYREVMR